MRKHTFCQRAGIAQLVERHLAKVEVAGSSPVSRSIGLSQDPETGPVFILNRSYPGGFQIPPSGGRGQAAWPEYLTSAATSSPAGRRSSSTAISVWA